MVHRHDADVLGLDVPWGIVVAVAPLVPLGLLADRTVSLGSASLMIGWGLVLVLQGSTSRGQYLIADDAPGWAFMLVGLGLLVTIVLRNSRLRQ